MKSPKPVCVTVLPWLRANLGDRCLAPLTGSDAKALSAAVQIINQYCYDPDDSLLVAFHNVVSRMQPHCQEFAYHAIAHVMNWEDRSEIWVKAGLPEFAPRLCAFEPGAERRSEAA